MVDTTFIHQVTKIEANWANDVNDITYGLDRGVKISGDTMTGDLLHNAGSFSIMHGVDNTQRLLLSGASSIATASGAYIALEGIDYPSAGNGGMLYLRAAAGKNVSSNQNIVIEDATPTDDSHATRKDYVDAVAKQVSAPATATATGAQGNIAFDSSFFYVCIATDTWVRSALTTW